MALGVTTPGPLVPCMSGLRFVSAPTFRWSASSYATPSASRRGLGRQMSTRESDMWSGLKAGTGSGGKPVIDSGTRKWGCSMEHISSARQQKSAFNNEETAVATNGCYTADYRQGRPIRGPYRGQNAVEREALALGRVRISEPDRVLDDRALASRRSQNGMINSPVTGHSLLDERVGPSTFWLEGSDKPASMHSVCPEQESYSKHWSAPAADIDRVAPSQRSQRPRQTSFTTLQREGSYPPQASYDGNFSVHGERNAMNRISASADLCTEDLVQSDVSNRSRQISRGFEHTSNGFCRTSSQNTYVYEESDEPSLAYSDKALEWGESVPFRDGAYSYQCHGNPRNYTGKNIAGKATNNKYGSPQKSIVQPSQKISCGGMGEINSDSVMSDGYSSYGRQKYYAIGKQSTHQTDVTFNRKSDCYNVLAQKSKFEHRLNEEESFLSSFSEYYPNEALNRGQSVSKQLVDLQLLETQTRQRQNARLDSFIASHNHHGPGMFAKETSIAEKSNGESGSSWREEGKKITARIMQAADSIGIAKADSKHRMSYTCSASGHEELSTISKQGRGNMVGVSASKIVVSHSVPQTHKLEPAGVEKDVFSASSITSQVGSNRGELAKSSVARLNGKPQEQKLERRSDAEICLGNNSIGMCVESSETVEHCLDNTTSTGDSINETAISAVCFSNNNLNKSVQLQSEKPEKGDHDLDNTIRVNYGHNGTITFAACYGNNSSNKSIQLQYGKQFSNLADREGKILSAGKGEFRLLRENGHLQDCSVGGDKKETLVINGKHARTNENKISTSTDAATGLIETKGGGIKERLNCLYKNIFIVDKVETAKMVVAKLMGEYKHLVHACDTEVANIDVKKESPVGHGNIICFSIYCGPQADFGKGKSCVWVDVLDGGEDVLAVFAPYFEDSSIRKVWHNYSFDCHIMANHGINVRGFHADTMHLARLWNSARRGEGGYSLEALTKDPKVMNGAGMVGEDELIAGKVSMKTIFGKKKTKKDGSEGKLVTVASVEELQRTERIPWICYSALDSMSTLRLWKSLQGKLMCMDWVFQGVSKGNMYDFYEEYWRPFGELLVQMESTGMLVDRKHLSEMEKVAIREQEISASRFRKWASKYCSDASYMNVSSDTQVRQLLFGGMPNKKDPKEFLPLERTLKVPNVDNFIEEGKKAPTKFRNIVLRGLGVKMQVETYTASGWPAVTGEALRMLAGKVSIDYDSLEKDMEDGLPADTDEGSPVLTSGGVKIGETTVGTDVEVDSSVYGTAYHAFGGGQNGREACHAIAALCEVSSINTLISNFLQPLQESQILGRKGRVHCSLNINTETGRLSARRPNLQNQPALEKDRYKIRQAFIADPGMTLIVADYGQLELRILAHLSNCKSMLDAFRAGGDFHSRTAMNMYEHVRKAVENKEVLLEWDPQPGEEKPPVPLLKDVFATERRRAKMLNFSIAYGKTAVGLSKDWKVSLKDAKETLKLWYNERPEVLKWQEERKHEASSKQCVHTLLGRSRHFPNLTSASPALRGHIERAAINAPVQGSAADVAMCAMLQIARNERLEKLGWKLLLQVHDEVILEGPIETAEEAKSLVVNCMSYPFNGKNILQVDLAVAATYGLSWYAAK